MNDINTIVINLVTFATAVGTLLTVREMNKQRKASYRPELILESVVFSGYNNHNSSCFQDNIECNFPVNWVKEIIPHESNPIEKEKILPNWFYISLLNIGLGAAREISGFWSFPIIEIVKEINQLAEKELFIFKKEVLSLTTGHNIMWGTDKKINFDYVLPVATQKESVGVRIPITYMTLVSAFIYSSVLKKGSLPKIAPLEFFVEYFDIGGVKYKTKINIFFELEACSQSFFTACLQPKKIVL